MALSRHGSGPGALLRALGSQVHPVFMLPPVAVSLFGATLAGDPTSSLAAIHALAVAFAVYTAHVTDGYVDFHVRGEDDDHPLTVPGCRLALLGAGAGFAACLAAIWTLAGPAAAAVTFPLWVIGSLHAPHLDTNPVTASVGYPTGVALALFGGFYVQTLVVGAAPLAFALVFWILLTGVKVVDDATDVAYDRSIEKRTLAVVVGRRRARRIAHGLFYVAFVLVLWLTVAGLFPPAAPVAALAFGVVAFLARTAPPALATKLLVRGAYLFLAGLLAGVWFAPLSSVGLPDVGVLGPYTYLATEVVFGTVALALLVRAGRDRVRAAVRTVAVVYPLAYVWDWYTLEVGVFEIPLRTGLEFAGIPVEEHLFMLVVPAFVLAVHATLQTMDPKQ